MTVSSGKSGMLVDHALECGSISAAAGKFLAVLENHDVFATIDRNQFLDLPDVDDCGSVNANKVVRIESLRDSTDRFPEEMELLADV